jgi:ATP-dependent DNA ligase
VFFAFDLLHLNGEDAAGAPNRTLDNPAMEP